MGLIRGNLFNWTRKIAAKQELLLVSIARLADFALHQRHISQVDSMLQRCLSGSADLSLREFIASLIHGMIELHRAGPELSDLLQAEVPHRAEGTPALPVRLYGPIRKALALRSRELGRTTNLDMQASFLKACDL